MSYYSGSRMQEQTHTEPPVSSGILHHKYDSGRNNFSIGESTDFNSPGQLFNPASISTFAGSRFGRDFSQVRLHADKVSNPLPSRYTGLTVQRFSRDGTTDSAACPSCPDVESTQTSAYAEPTALTPEAVSTPEQSEPAEETAVTEAAARQGLIVDDSATELGPGQMRKSEFLAQLRTEVCSTVEAAIAGSGRSTEGCPYLDHWFGYYSRQDSAHTERAIRRYAPEASNATTARGYISVITQRARQAAETWARTGEIAGIPEGIPTSLPGESPAGGEGGAETSTGSVMFKAREGGARAADDPQAIQRELGEGSPLDSGVRSRMESAFGMDFSHVRTHTDTTAAGLSNRFNARAFTVGKDIAFGAGEYQPGSLLGDALIAHELAHVVQQGGSSTEVTSMQMRDSCHNALEKDADDSVVSALVSLWGDAKGKLVHIAQNAIPRLRSGLQLQRCCDDSNLPTGLLPLKLPAHNCNPQGKTLGEVEKMGGKKDVLGATQIADMRFKVDSKGEWGGFCNTTLTIAPVFALKHSVYTQAGTYNIGNETPTKGRCKGRTLVRKEEITPPMAEKIKKGEIEHCNDYRRFFALTYGRYAEAIEELEVEHCGVGGKCAPKLEQHFKERTGTDYNQKKTVAKCLIGKTGLRDEKPNEWHSVVLKNPVYDRMCKTATYKPDHTKQLLEIDKHSSKSIVKGCGEP